MRFLCALAAFIVLSLACEPVLAAERLTLLDTLPEPDTSSNPANFKRVGNLLFFNANGSEIWVTDGTEAGTRKTTFTGTIDDTYYASDTALYRYKVSTAYAMPSLVEYKDGPEGPLQATLIEIQCDTTPRPKSIIEYKGEIYFTAKVGPAMGYPESGIELVACKRGEPDTYRMVADIRSGANSSSPTDLVVCDGLLFFSADKMVYLGGLNQELQRLLHSTNGTITAIVSSYKSPSTFICADDVLYFIAENKLVMRKQGTGEIIVISTSPWNLCPMGKALYYASGDDVWKTDGISGTASRITNNDNYVLDLAVAGESLFFTVIGTTGTELWAIGSDNEPIFLKQLNANRGYEKQLLLVADLNGSLVFAFKARTGVVGLWKSDGTAEGTMLIKWLGSGFVESPCPSAVVNGYLIFEANDFFHGMEMHVYDGTAEDTRILANLNLGATSLSNIRPVVKFKNRLVFKRTCGGSTYIGSTDGTPDSAKFIAYGDVSEVAFMSSFRNNGVFPGVELPEFFLFPSGGALGSNDGISEGLNDLVKLPAHSFPHLINLINEKAYVRIGVPLMNPGSPPPANLPIMTDGSSDHTVSFGDLGVSVSYYDSVFDNDPFLGVIGDNAILGFEENRSLELGSELFRSNGTISGTRLIKDINPGSNASRPGYGAMTGNLVYFRATTPEAGAELWRTNGYETGTKLVEDIVPGTGSSNPSCLGATDAAVMIFCANGDEIWRSNGNAAGTYLLKDTLEGTTYRSFEYVGTHLGKAYISARTPNELWVSDGSVTGTKKIADAASSNNQYRYLGPVGDYLFVTNPSGQICATDGSELTLISTNTSQGVFSDKYFYQCIGQSEHGTTFLRSDGTAEGTQQFTAPSAGSSPVLLGILDGQLIYSVATTEPNAQKIWSFELREDAMAHEWMIYQ